jgi:lipopolysaccharide transport system permease protein/teichoic acid transport system permease protein
MKFILMLAGFIKNIAEQKRLLWSLTKKDFKEKYLGSYLGILWAFIQPMITVLIFWFVFEIGFKAMPVDNFPFILWLVCGMFPWFFFAEAISNATGSITDNSYLVKKVVFKVSLLPMVKIISTLLVHLFFIVITVIMFAIYGYMPSLYNLQVIYYLFALCCLVFGLSLITSTLIIFLKDVGQLVGMCIQFGFWGTPIFWNIAMIPEKYQWLIKCNPMYYIVNGYRDSFIAHEWFWEKGMTTLGFWLVTAAVMLLGVYLFKKLRPHFADVL